MSSIANHLPLQLQRKPLIVTVAVHAILLLLLFLWRFSVPQPAVQYPEMGMEVNLGTSTDGMGDDQPMNVEDPAPHSAATAHAAQAHEPDESPEIVRSTREDAPSVAMTRPGRRPARETQPQERRAAQQRATGTTSPAPQPQARYVYPGATGTGGNGAQTNVSGTGEGISGKPGDQGVPRGTPGATNYSGVPGSGTGGMTHSLDGRNIVAFPPKEAAFREGGKVVIRVTVNREGMIVSRSVKKSTNTELNPIALRKLQQVRFNKSMSAPAEQFGDITFVFRPR